MLTMILTKYLHCIFVNIFLPTKLRNYEILSMVIESIIAHSTL